MGLGETNFLFQQIDCAMDFFTYFVGPSILIITMGHEFSGMSELKIGGLMYLVGICFFKADG